MQDDLDSKVDVAIQDAMASFSAAEMQ